MRGSKEWLLNSRSAAVSYLDGSAYMTLPGLFSARSAGKAASLRFWWNLASSCRRLRRSTFKTDDFTYGSSRLPGQIFFRFFLPVLNISETLWAFRGWMMAGSFRDDSCGADRKGPLFCLRPSSECPMAPASSRTGDVPPVNELNSGPQTMAFVACRSPSVAHFFCHST